MTLFAWGFVAGYVVGKLITISMIGAILSAKREANRQIAEARERARTRDVS